MASLSQKTARQERANEEYAILNNDTNISHVSSSSNGIPRKLQAETPARTLWKSRPELRFSDDLLVGHDQGPQIWALECPSVN